MIQFESLFFLSMLTRVATKNLQRFSERLIKESIIKGEGQFKNLILRGRCLGLLKPNVLCFIYVVFGFNRKNLSQRGRAINLASLNKNLLLKGHCPRRIFEDLRCNSDAHLYDDDDRGDDDEDDGDDRRKGDDQHLFKVAKYFSD